MCIFKQICYNPLLRSFENLHYIPKIINCYNKYSKYLRDDFTTDNGFSYIQLSVPYLWAICENSGEFMGFVSLDNFVGNNNIIFSAEVTACYEFKAWGNFTRHSANLFLKKCFRDLGLYKVKAQVFPDNCRVTTLLKSLGFIYETRLRSETMRNGKIQDIDLYSINSSDYEKKEEKNYEYNK